MTPIITPVLLLFFGATVEESSKSAFLENIILHQINIMVFGFYLGVYELSFIFSFNHLYSCISNFICISWPLANYQALLKPWFVAKGNTQSCTQSWYCRPVVALTRDATSAFASPKEVNLKEVSSDRNNVLLLNTSVRSPACFLPYVKVLLFTLALYQKEKKEKNVLIIS